MLLIRDISSSICKARLLSRQWAEWVWLPCVLFLYHLTANGSSIVDKPVWLDEGSTFFVARHPFGEIFDLAATFQAQPPVYYWLIHFLLKVSSGELWLRGLSWLTCLGVVAALYFSLRKRLCLEARFVVALLFIANGCTYYLSQEMRSYGVSAFLVCASTWVFAEFLQNRSTRNELIYISITTMLLYTQTINLWTYSAQILFAIIFLISKAVHNERKIFLEQFYPVARAIGAVGLIYIPFFLFLIQAQKHKTYEVPIGKMVSAAFNPAYFAAALRYFSGSSTGFILVAAVLILMGVWKGSSRDRWDLCLWIIVCAGQVSFAHVLVEGRSFFASRYLTPGYVAYVMLIAIGLNVILRNLTSRYLILIPVLVSLGLLGKSTVAWTKTTFAPVREKGARHFVREMEKVAGRKAIFVDTGWRGQIFEYQSRFHKDYIFYTNRTTGWGAAGTVLDQEYIQRSFEVMDPETRCVVWIGADNDPRLLEVILPELDKRKMDRQRSFSDTETRTSFGGYAAYEYCKE